MSGRLLDFYILQEYEPIYFQYRSLLTSAQWSLLRAISKEEKLTQPTSFDFISKHELSSPSSVKRTLESLIDKEMVIELQEEAQNYYRVYDVFLGRWMQRK